MNISKQRLMEIIREEITTIKENYRDEDWPDERYIAAGLDPPSEQERAWAADPDSALIRQDTEVEGEDFIIYRGMKYHLPTDPDEREAVESFIDAFLDRD